MNNPFHFTDVTTTQWILSIVCMVIIGASKTGVTGAGLIAVPILASMFGGKPSAGLILPLLSVADFVAVWYYHRHVEWKHLVRIMPWALGGVIGGVLFGRWVTDLTFKYTIAIIVFVSLGIMVWRDVSGKNKKVPSSRWFSSSTGLSVGFASMIGNAAGPLTSLYLLTVRLPKNAFIATGAWFYCILNLAKTPFHIFSWHTISGQTLLFDLAMLPAIGTGTWLGIRIVNLIPERYYRLFVIVVTFISAIVLIVRR